MLPIVSICNILMSRTAIYIMCNVLDSTSQRTQWDYIKNTSWQILWKAITAVYCRNHMEHIKTLCTECRVKPGYKYSNHWAGRSQWPRGLRHRSMVACLLRLWVWIPLEALLFVCCECCVLSGRGLCDELITRPEESYRLWCVVVCDLETSRMRRPWLTLGCSTTAKKYIYIYLHAFIFLNNLREIHYYVMSFN
jgi:hypothetical protein